MKYSSVLLLLTLAFVSASKVKNDAKSEKVVQKCPKGYIQREGTLADSTLGEMEKNMDEDQCAKNCDEQIQCKSFEYHPGSKKCRIIKNHASKPNSTPPTTVPTVHLQYRWCQKEAWPYHRLELSSGIPLLEATMNLSEDLAGGTNAPIPSKMSEKLEDLKASTVKELSKEASGDLSEDLTEKSPRHTQEVETSPFVTVNDFTNNDQTVKADAVKAMKSNSVTHKTVTKVTTAPNKSKVSPGIKGKQNPKSRSLTGDAKSLASHKNRHLVNDKKCGRPSTFTSKIVGGESATIEEFPWLALLAMTQKASNGKMEFMYDNPSYICGGSLISDKWVLTAGHCVVQRFTADPVEGIRAKFGATTRTQKTGYVEIDSQRIVLHEKYAAETKDLPVDFDIALIKLKRGMSAFGKDIAQVNTVCLPFDYVAEKSWAGKSLVVAGWGYEYQDPLEIHDRIADDLQKLKVNRMSNQKCRAAHDNTQRIATTKFNQNLCAGGVEGQDSCKGDSGGPLMLEQERMGRKNHTLVGIVSWGTDLCGQKNIPGVYADVSFFLEWILNKID